MSPWPVWEIFQWAQNHVSEGYAREAWNRGSFHHLKNMFVFVVPSFGGWNGPVIAGMIFPIFINFPWQHCWVSRKRGSWPWIWVRFLPRECARLRLRARSLSWSSEVSWWARWKVELLYLKSLFNEILLIFYMEKAWLLSQRPACSCRFAGYREKQKRKSAPSPGCCRTSAESTMGTPRTFTCQESITRACFNSTAFPDGPPHRYPIKTSSAASLIKVSPFLETPPLLSQWCSENGGSSKQLLPAANIWHRVL